MQQPLSAASIIQNDSTTKHYKNLPNYKKRFRIQSKSVHCLPLSSALKTAADAEFRRRLCCTRCLHGSLFGLGWRCHMHLLPSLPTTLLCCVCLGFTHVLLHNSKTRQTQPRRQGQRPPRCSTADNVRPHWQQHASPSRSFASHVGMEDA